jgi:hypothetical protein
VQGQGQTGAETGAGPGAADPKSPAARKSAEASDATNDKVREGPADPM